MKRWRTYEQYLTTGEWHVHTSYVDGKNTVDQLCLRATELGIPLLVFTEHVRRTLTYDFDLFLSDLERAKKKYALTILSGCEAKVLGDGSLDAPDDLLALVDLPMIAFHSFPYPVSDYLLALEKALANPLVNIWAHPGLYLQKQGLDINEATLNHLLALCRERDVLLEYNSQYDLPRPEWRAAIQAAGMPLCRGSNIHDIDQLQPPGIFVPRS